jgi:spermidine synthase
VLWLYLGIALVSGTALFYEVVLTRLLAIAQGYHFGFLVISLALLGFGASGTALALWNARGRRAPSVSILPPLAALLALALPASYLLANYLPLDPYRLAWEPAQFVFLAAYLLALAIPFFIAGSVQGLTLTLWSERASSLYAANLVGSGVGCLLALGALNVTSAPGSVLVGALIAALAVWAFAIEPRVRGQNRARVQRLSLGASAALVLGVTFLLVQSGFAQVPAWFDLRLSPYKSLEQILNYPAATRSAQRSNAFARVDVIESRNIRSAPGLSLAFTGAFPRQTGIIVDADNVLALTPRQEVSPALLEALPIALPFQLRPHARVLVLEPGGGLDIWAALHYDARAVTAVEKNPLVAELLREREGNPYAEPRVQLAVEDARGFLARHDETFDVIDLALTENFRAVTAGAFTLSEDYVHTVEAFCAYLDQLAPNGLLVIQRWLQLPPTEELRAAALAVEALRERGVAVPAQHLVALRSFNTMLILVKREPFAPNEIAFLKTFARARQFDLVHYPGIQPDEVNRFNKLARDVYYESFRALLAAPAQLYAQSEYDIAPPRDDRPFYFHFFKWEQLPTILALLGKMWQPFGGSGYLILLVLLGIALLLAAALILLPLAFMRQRALGREGRRVLIYFGALGLGFLLIEIPLIQRFILLLDYPVYAFTVTLFGLLIFSGVGSACAERVSWRGALFALLITLGIYAFALDRVIAWALGYAFAARVLMALLALAPLGFLLGIPFPRGIAALSARHEEWIPLAWGVNGFMSVLSSILATLIALAWGFGWVWLAGAGMYAIAAVAIWSRCASTVQIKRP